MPPVGTPKAARRWWILAAMTGTMSMMLVDATVVSVALPTIQQELSLSSSGVRWVMNAYLLAVAVLIAAGGRLADIYGHARVFIAGIVVFISASAAGGAAQSEEWLIAARAVQGAGAAAMVPAAVALVTTAFPASERGRAMSLYTGISMGFLALGPLIGGALTDGWSWRGVFLINLPVGLAVLGLALAVLPRDRRAVDARIDYAGLVSIVVGLGAIVVALVQASVWGWGSPWTLSLLGAGGIAMAAFVAIELRASAPLLELRLFANRNFAVDLGVLAVARFVLMGLTVLGAVWLQEVLGLSPAETGLALLVMTIPMLITAPVAGWLYDRIGPRWPIGVGSALMAFGFGWSAAVLHVESFWLLVPGLVAIGVGIAPAMVSASSDSLNQTPPELRAEAAGASLSVRQVGATLGLAVMAAVAAAVENTRLDEVVAASTDPVQLERTLADVDQGDTEAIAGLPPEDLEPVLDAVTDGVSASFWLAAGLLLIAAIIAPVLLRRLAPVDTPAPETEGRSAPDRGDMDGSRSLRHHLP